MATPPRRGSPSNAAKVSVLISIGAPLPTVAIAYARPNTKIPPWILFIFVTRKGRRNSLNVQRPMKRIMIPPARFSQNSSPRVIIAPKDEAKTPRGTNTTDKPAEKNTADETFPLDPTRLGIYGVTIAKFTGQNPAVNPKSATLNQNISFLRIIIDTKFNLYVASIVSLSQNAINKR